MGGPITVSVPGCGPGTGTRDLSQHPYWDGKSCPSTCNWVGTSCTGLGDLVPVPVRGSGPGTRMGCPILGWEVPFQHRYWYGDPVQEWGILYWNGGPCVGTCTGLRAQYWDGDSLRAPVPGWEPSTRMGAWYWDGILHWVGVPHQHPYWNWVLILGGGCHVGTCTRREKPRLGWGSGTGTGVSCWHLYWERVRHQAGIPYWHPQRGGVCVPHWCLYLAGDGGDLGDPSPGGCLTTTCRGDLGPPSCCDGSPEPSLLNRTQGQPGPLRVTAWGLSPASPPGPGTLSPAGVTPAAPLPCCTLQAPRPHGGVPHSLPLPQHPGGVLPFTFHPHPHPPTTQQDPSPAETPPIPLLSLDVTHPLSPTGMGTKPGSGAVSLVGCGGDTDAHTGDSAWV